MSETAELYSRLPIYRRRVAEAEDIIAAGLKRCEKPYIACSFGKDSAAMLHLVLRFAPHIKIRFCRFKGETEFLNNYDEVIFQWLEQYDLNLEVLEFERVSRRACLG